MCCRALGVTRMFLCVLTRLSTHKYMPLSQNLVTIFYSLLLFKVSSLYYVAFTDQKYKIKVEIGPC